MMLANSAKRLSEEWNVNLSDEQIQSLLYDDEENDQLGSKSRDADYETLKQALLDTDIRWATTTLYIACCVCLFQ